MIKFKFKYNTIIDQKIINISENYNKIFYTI